MSGKRKRSGSNGETKKPHRRKARRASFKTKPAVERQAVPQDQLQWQEVAIPETLEDAEGFYGLEEIDDVEVERTGKNILYKVRQINTFHTRD